MITTGAGEAWVIGGEGADAITDGDGKAVLFGDLGAILAGANGLIRLETTYEAIGGADVITKADGEAFAFGGAMGDQISMGAGDHTVSGDMGVLTFANGIRSRLLVEISTPAWGGDDTIAVGVGDSWLIGAEGNDVLQVAGGETAILGDAGWITADAAGRVNEIQTLQPTLGGNDTILGGSGRDIALGGAASDFLDGAAGDDMLVGDAGHFSRVPIIGNATIFTLEQSADFIYGGDDTLLGGAGRDLMIGGTGHDYFQVDYTDDFASGEFGRFRLLATADGEEHLVSVLTLAPRDLDLIGNVGERLFYKTPRKADVMAGGLGSTLTLEELMRVDVLVLEDNELAVSRLFGNLTETTTVSGLRSFRLLSEGDLLTTPNLIVEQDSLLETEVETDQQASAASWQFEGWTMTGQS